jgi:hypothetical protein
MRVGRVGWDAVGWEARMWVGGATSLCPICVAVANADGSTSPAWSSVCGIIHPADLHLKIIQQVKTLKSSGKFIPMAEGALVAYATRC